MSRVFVCLSVLFVLTIAIQFGDCENNTTQPECDGNIKSGSDKTHISVIEGSLKELSASLKKWNKIIGRSNNDSQPKDDKGSVSKILNMFKEHVHLIAPGTRWCGDGDIARDEDDLGFFKDTDACCRAHDNCKNDLLAGETEVNIINNGIFTRSACTCDFGFYNCLKNASNLIATKIGTMYFNILGQQCFQCICPTEDCGLEDDTECKGHCKKYKWVDSPKFINIFQN
ncbi:phospholipase A2 [Monomorium pharaonis]|uniref:phospholipase A2 n=1 Tax=Monomorium pharaonis TaxID=307658 RepID=UPI001746BF0E|nr:phospholipase A2 [Monomorium pharaonis]XP_036144445.1 phospholipase A2 [Monomorium pharaonis]